MKLKLSYLLSVCLLMSSCSGGTSGNVSDSGTSAYPSTAAYTPNTSTSTPKTGLYKPVTCSGTATFAIDGVCPFIYQNVETYKPILNSLGN
jgi:hypothetical protein